MSSDPLSRFDVCPECYNYTLERLEADVYRLYIYDDLSYADELTVTGYIGGQTRHIYTGFKERIKVYILFKEE